MKPSVILICVAASLDGTVVPSMASAAGVLRGMHTVGHQEVAIEAPGQQTSNMLDPVDVLDFDKGEIDFDDKGVSTCCHMTASDDTVDANGTAKILPDVTLEECKARCSRSSCTAVEYDSKTHRCEIHTEPIHDFYTCIGRGEFRCYVAMSTTLTSTITSTSTSSPTGTSTSDEVVEKDNTSLKEATKQAEEALHTLGMEERSVLKDLLGTGKNESTATYTEMRRDGNVTVFAVFQKEAQASGGKRITVMGESGVNTSVQLPEALLSDSTAVAVSTMSSDGRKLFEDAAVQRLSNASKSLNVSDDSDNNLSSVLSGQPVKITHYDLNGSEQKVEDLGDPVKFSVPDATNNSQCAFWDEKHETWSRRGVTSMRGESGELHCESKHLSFFAAIKQFALDVYMEESCFIEHSSAPKVFSASGLNSLREEKWRQTSPARFVWILLLLFSLALPLMLWRDLQDGKKYEGHDSIFRPPSNLGKKGKTCCEHLKHCILDFSPYKQLCNPSDPGGDQADKGEADCERPHDPDDEQVEDSGGENNSSSNSSSNSNSNSNAIDDDGGGDDDGDSNSNSNAIDDDGGGDDDGDSNSNSNAIDDEGEDPDDEQDPGGDQDPKTTAEVLDDYLEKTKEDLADLLKNRTSIGNLVLKLTIVKFQPVLKPVLEPLLKKLNLTWKELLDGVDSINFAQEPTILLKDLAEKAGERLLLSNLKSSLQEQGVTEEDIHKILATIQKLARAEPFEKSSLLRSIDELALEVGKLVLKFTIVKFQPVLEPVLEPLLKELDLTWKELLVRVDSIDFAQEPTILLKDLAEKAGNGLLLSKLDSRLKEQGLTVEDIKAISAKIQKLARAETFDPLSLLRSIKELALDVGKLVLKSTIVKLRPVFEPKFQERGRTWENVIGSLHKVDGIGKLTVALQDPKRFLQNQLPANSIHKQPALQNPGDPTNFSEGLAKKAGNQVPENSIHEQPALRNRGDVTPVGLGIEIEGGQMATLIPRNSHLPIKKSTTFSTVHDHQTSIYILIYEGEHQIAKQNNKLGQMILSGLPPAPAGAVQVDVMLCFDTDGILHVSAKGLRTQASASVTINVDKGRLSEEMVESCDDLLKSLKEWCRKQLFRLLRLLLDLLSVPDYIVKKIDGPLPDAVKIKKYLMNLSAVDNGYCPDTFERVQKAEKQFSDDKMTARASYNKAVMKMTARASYTNAVNENSKNEDHELEKSDGVRRAWMFFKATHPLSPLLTFSIFRSRSARLAILASKLLGAMVIAALGLDASGCKSKFDGWYGELVFRFSFGMWVHFSSKLVQGFWKWLECCTEKAELVMTKRRRNSQKDQQGENKKAQENEWTLRISFFWFLWILYFAASVSYILIFIAVTPMGTDKGGNGWAYGIFWNCVADYVVAPFWVSALASCYFVTMNKPETILLPTLLRPSIKPETKFSARALVPLVGDQVQEPGCITPPTEAEPLLPPVRDPVPAQVPELVGDPPCMSPFYGPVAF